MSIFCRKIFCWICPEKKKETRLLKCVSHLRYLAMIIEFMVYGCDVPAIFSQFAKEQSVPIELEAFSSFWFPQINFYVPFNHNQVNFFKYLIRNVSIKLASWYSKVLFPHSYLPHHHGVLIRISVQWFFCSLYR